MSHYSAHQQAWLAHSLTLEGIWQIVESVIELPQGYIEAENAKREAKQKQPAPQEPKKKERWKKTDRPVAKKTLRKEQKKKVKKK